LINDPSPRRRRRRLVAVVVVRIGRSVRTPPCAGGQQSHGLRGRGRYRICNWVRRLRRLSFPCRTRLRPPLHVI